MTPSVGLINLPEQLSETFYLLDPPFIIKGFNSGAADGRCTGQGVGEGRGASLPSAPLSPDVRMLSKPGALQTRSLGVVEAS